MNADELRKKISIINWGCFITLCLSGFCAYKFFDEDFIIYTKKFEINPLAITFLVLLLIEEAAKHFLTKKLKHQLKVLEKEKE